MVGDQGGRALQQGTASRPASRRLDNSAVNAEYSRNENRTFPFALRIRALALERLLDDLTPL